MIARCKTCSFWTAYPAGSPQWGVCKAEDAQSSLMWASGKSEDAEVFTHETFGCVMHPANEAIK